MTLEAMAAQGVTTPLHKHGRRDEYALVGPPTHLYRYYGLDGYGVNLPRCRCWWPNRCGLRRTVRPSTPSTASSTKPGRLGFQGWSWPPTRRRPPKGRRDARRHVRVSGPSGLARSCDPGVSCLRHEANQRNGSGLAGWHVGHRAGRVIGVSRRRFGAVGCCGAGVRGPRGFVLDPTGRVVVSVYSSGAIGRLLPEDVVGLIRCLREHAARHIRTSSATLPTEST